MKSRHLLLPILLTALTTVLADSPWTWVCENDTCVKKEREGVARGLEACKMTCGQGTTWPLPVSQKLSQDLLALDKDRISFTTKTQSKFSGEGEDAESLLKEASQRFLVAVGRAAAGALPVGGLPMQVTFLLKEANFSGFHLHQDEAYSLYVCPTSDSKINATIVATNFLGARNGLETLSQLVVLDNLKNEMVVPRKVEVEDRPRYTYRGILLDTARNYISVPAILRTVDAMASNKLNTFHWHITDAQSFPFESKSYPKLSEYGAYSPNKVYTKEDIEKVVRYAKVRGVRVVPELDTPAHVGEGWQWAQDATVCFKAEPWQSYCVEPPCGQLNPTSDKVYDILQAIYADMEESFRSDLFHMGGDEVNINCWNSSDPVVQGMAKMGLGRSYEDFHTVWAKFQERAVERLERAAGKKRPVILWTSSLTAKDHVDQYLDKDKYIIQVWTRANDSLIQELLNKGFPIIMSNYDALYFDCGFGAWIGEGNNWCSPFTPWQTVYLNDPVSLAVRQGVSKERAEELTLGSEACLWTEQADDSTIDSRLWPRGSAMAEGLWRGQAGEGSWEAAEPRYLAHRERLVAAGVTANTIQPTWCLQNQGYCHN